METHEWNVWLEDSIDQEKVTDSPEWEKAQERAIREAQFNYKCSLIKNKFLKQIHNIKVFFWDKQDAKWWDK